MARRGSGWSVVAALAGLFGTLGLVAFAGRSSAPTPRKKKIALIGDSYAVGLGPELQKLLTDFKFEGHVGTNSSQWVTHAPACGQCGDWLVGYKPDVVLVSLGTNDGTLPNPQNYQTIVKTLHGIGATAVWIEPPAGLAVNRDAVRRVIASLGVPTVPATKTPLGADGIHPQHYDSWAKEVAGAVA